MKGISGITLNAEMQQAWDFIENTGVSVFLTGKAGTGKTTFLRYLTQHTVKTFIVTAPTGVAAINAGGVTLHSFFQLPLSPFVPGTGYKSVFRFSKEKLRIIQALDLLIIDEISMVRSDLLDAIDATLRRLRGNTLPFGGVQLLLIGDLQQLAPVVTARDAEVLKGYFSTSYFFGSKALERLPYITVGLRQIYRQQNPEFIRLLNHVRDNSLSAADLQYLNALCRPDFEPEAEEGYIRLTTHNRQAELYNKKCLDSLTTAPFTFNAIIEGDFPESSFPTDKDLVLKEGVQVMFIKNDNFDHKFYNGKIGTVISLSDEHVIVRCHDDDEEVDVQPMKWENNKYEIDEETNSLKTIVEGTFTQLPLRHARAITIHKSQGLTFNRAVIDAGAAFTPGQVYVALSRCRTLDGLVLTTPIRSRSMNSDPRVLDYVHNCLQVAKSNTDRIEDCRIAYRKSLLQEMFRFNDIGEAIYHLRTIAEERLGKKGVQTADLLLQAERNMQTDITDISLKWCATIEHADATTLDSPRFCARIENSISYFLDKLESQVITPLEVLENVKPANKQVATKWNETKTEFDRQCKIKRYILENLAGRPFTSARYLEMRRNAIIDATKKKSSKKARKVKVRCKKQP